MAPIFHHYSALTKLVRQCYFHIPFWNLKDPKVDHIAIRECAVNSAAVDCSFVAFYRYNGRNVGAAFSITEAARLASSALLGRKLYRLPVDMLL